MRSTSEFKFQHLFLQTMPKRRTKAKNTTDASNSVPRKRTRRSTRLNDAAHGETDEAKDNHPSTEPSDNGSSVEESAPSTQPHNDNDGHSDSDSDDHMDWEHIDMSAPTTAAEDEEEDVEDEQPVTYQDVEVVFEAPRAVLK